MLQRIRDNASGPIAYVIVGLIAVVFGVWGIGSYFTENPNPAVAEAGGTEITKYQLQRAYDQRYQRLQRLMGDEFDHDVIEPSQFRRTVLEGLIQEALLQQYAEDNGYRTTDQALLRALRSERQFQVDGRFSPERYRALLSQAGISPGAFEAGLREDLQVAQVREGLLQTSFITHRDVAAAYRLDNQRRDLAYLSFQVEDYLGDVEVEDSQIQAYYDAHPQMFTRPERVKLGYVELDRNDLVPADKPEREFLQVLYEQEKDARFRTAERRRARHILIREDEDTNADQARQRIQELAVQVEEGGDFAALAREHSDDATADQGGQLDWVSRGSMVKPFEEVLFQLEEGEVSHPVKTDFGWHLIKLQEVDPAETRPFDDPQVQTELLELYRARERDERFQQMSERLDSLSFEAPNSLEPIADELGLEVHETGWLTRSQSQGLGEYEAVRKAAFSDAVLKDRLNSTPIELSRDRLVVLRVLEHQAGMRRPLSEVRDEIADRLRREKAAKAARSQAEEAHQALSEGRSPTTVAEESGAELRTPGWVTRDDGNLPAAVRTTLFAMPRPTGEGAQYALAELEDGGSAVLRLSGIKEGEPANDDPADRERRRRELRGRIAGLEYASFRQSLRNRYDVKIYEERID